MSFLKYVDGAMPGKKPQKRKTASEEDSKKKYEIKRQRAFQDHWSKDRPWLRFDQEKGLMFCDWCITSTCSEDSAFVKGCSLMKLDTIKQHEKSKVHISMKLRNSVSVGSSQAAKCVYKLKQADYDKLSIKFRNAHYVAKHHRSFKEYTQLCLLDQAKGLDIGTSYINDKYCAKFVSSIAKVTLDTVLENVQTASFFSITCDGSADFTGDDYESIYIRTSIHGKVVDQFFHIGLPASGCASDIHEFIACSFKDADLEDEFSNKLIGFCSDGASNMQGKNKGLAALLKTTRPYLVSVHCLVHRLELAFKDTIKSDKQYDKAMTLLLGLYYFYRKSPKMKLGLKRSFESLNVKQVLPTRVGGTRWMPHISRAIDNFFKAYTAIRNHLESSSHFNAKAEGFAKLAIDGHTIVFLLSLKELLKPLSRLSLCLQKKNLTLSDAAVHMKTTKTVLENLSTEEHESIKDVIQSSIFMNQDVKFAGPKPQPKLTSLIKSVLIHIESRFPEVSDVLSASSVANFRNWSLSNLADYGVEEVNTVTDHFQDILLKDDIQKKDVLEEWSALKALVKEKFPKELDSGDLDWFDVHRSFRNQGVDKALSLIDLLRTLPPTSVQNECSFSVMKLTKSKRRARLSPGTLRNLMTISIQGKSVEEFDPKEAVEHFMINPSGTKRNRRVHGYKKKQDSEDVETKEINVANAQDSDLEKGTGSSSQAVNEQLQVDSDSDSDWSDDNDDDEVEMNEDDVHKRLHEFTS